MNQGQVSQNLDHSIAFDEDAGTYSLFSGDPATGTNLDAIAHSLPNSVLFAGGADPIDTPGDEIIFHPDGSLNDSTATLDQIFLRNSQGDVFAISVNRATGRVLVELQSSGY